MTRNRVKHYADQRGWSVIELYRQVLMLPEKERIGQSTVENLYRQPDYMASIKSLEALAKVFGVKVTDLIEDV